MKLIPLSQGQFAQVDDNDYAYISQFNWFVRWNPSTNSFYAQRNFNLGNGKRTSMQMHREILGVMHGDPRRIDHKEPAHTLNNQRSNLRIATPSQNRANSRAGKSKTGFKGVRPYYNRFVVSIRKDGKSIYLGTCATSLEGHEIYKAAARKYHGEFANP